jgi:hypothetical protein
MTIAGALGGEGARARLNDVRRQVGWDGAGARARGPRPSSGEWPRLLHVQVGSTAVQLTFAASFLIHVQAFSSDEVLAMEAIFAPP